MPAAPFAAPGHGAGGPGHCPWPRGHDGRGGLFAGGYYATWVAQQAQCPSVLLLNPAVNPARDLALHRRTNRLAPARGALFLPARVRATELRALDVRDQPRPGPEMAIIAKGDEVLDWREMVARYPRRLRACWKAETMR